MLLLTLTLILTLTLTLTLTLSITTTLTLTRCQSTRQVCKSAVCNLHPAFAERLRKEGEQKRNTRSQ